jgi:cell division control protein 6
VTDTQYRVLAQLANKFIDENEAVITEEIEELRDLRDRARTDSDVLADTKFTSVPDIEDEIEGLEAEIDAFEDVPMTGWPTDRVYSSFFDAVDYRERVVVIMLDEIDKLVEKSGDDTLYNLSRMNSELENSRVSIMGISNDLKFTDFLDPRVKSSLGEEEIVFPPYDANQLRDILEHRADVAFKEEALTGDVIPLCAAFAAQEHGDARRALDLLRTAGELAERDQTDVVEEDHVRQAQEKIELDRVVEVVRTLPQQSKIVLFAIILLEKQGVHNVNTGEAFNIYKRLCEEIDADVLTQRRVTDLISELDMLGIVNAAVVSKGRYGRTKEISLSVPIEETEAVLLSDSRLGDIEDAQPFVQARFDN